MVMTISDRVGAYGAGFLGSALLHVLIVAITPGLMGFVGTTVVAMQLIFWPICIGLIVKSIQMKRDSSDENQIDVKILEIPKLQEIPKHRKFWTEPIQGCLYVAWGVSMLTALSLYIIQNQYYAESGLENEFLKNIVSLMVAIALSLTIPYVILYYKNRWDKEK